MTPEQIAKLDREKRLEREKRINDFIKKIESSGFIINDYIKVTELTELVAKGEVGPVNQLNALVNLKKQIESFDVVKVSNDFRRDLRNQFDTLLNCMSKNTKAPAVSAINKNITETERFSKLISNVKTKAGILLAENRVESAVASREETYQKIQDLSNNTSLNAEQKMVEYKRLLNIYNGANLDTIKNAKRITDRGNKDISIDYIDDLIQDFNKIYQEVMIMNLDDDTKKAMIDNFSNISLLCTKYKAMISTFISHEQRSERLLRYLGIKFNEEMSKEKEEDKAPEIKEQEPVIENIFKINDVVYYNGKKESILPGNGTSTPSLDLEIGKEYKVENIEIVDGITYYKLDGIDGLYESSRFDSKNLAEEEIKVNEEIIEREAIPVTLETSSLNSDEIQSIEEPKNILIPEEEKPEETNGLNNNLGDRVISVKDAKFKGYGTLTWKIIALSGLVAGASLSMAPLALVSAIIWAYSEYRDRIDISKKEKFFPSIVKKLKAKIASANVDNEKTNELMQLITGVYEENKAQGLVRELAEEENKGMGI
ncbi:MAG: hypothetical protein PHD03_02245 [Bacilli bacterium]|nr:hypothetical protein [Bacilli bacterium]